MKPTKEQLSELRKAFDLEAFKREYNLQTVVKPNPVTDSKLWVYFKDKLTDN